MMVIDDTLIDRLGVGVVVLDQEGLVVRFNTHEEQASHRRREDVVGRHFFREVARCTDIPEIRGVFEAGIHGGEIDVEMDFTFGLPFLPLPRAVRLHMRSFRHQGAPHAVLVFEDRPDADRRAQLNVLAHDLANPMVSVIGYTQMARADLGILPNAEVEDLLVCAEEASDRMLDMLQQAARLLRSGSMNLNLHALLLAAVSGALPVAMRQGIVLHYEGLVARPRFPERAVAILGEVAVVAAVVNEALRGAVARASVNVHVLVRTKADEVSVTFVDDGATVDVPVESMQRQLAASGAMAVVRPSDGGHRIELIFVAANRSEAV